MMGSWKLVLTLSWNRYSRRESPRSRRSQAGLLTLGDSLTSSVPPRPRWELRKPTVSVRSAAKVTSLAPSTMPTEKKLTIAATELVSLIPTLSGVDVSCLVASIKRCRLQRTRGSQARTTLRLTECTQPPPSPKAAPDPLPVNTKMEETRGIDEKTFQLELARLKYAVETQPTQKTEEESWSADGGTRSEQAITNEGNDLNPPSLAEALTRRATR